MAIVERGNVVLEIADDAIQHYLDKGYNVTDGKGNILQHTNLLSVGELHKLNAEKDAEIEELKKQLKELQDKLATAETEKPKRQRKAKVVEE